MRALAWTLVVATWRGPIPCVHFHGHDPEMAPASLAGHVRAYHDAGGAGEVPGWHVHLMLLQEAWRLSDCPAPRHEPDDPLVAQRTVLQLTEAASASLGLLLNSLSELGVPSSSDLAISLSSDVGTAALSNPATAGPSTFLGTFLIGAPLRAVTGVALC